MTVNLLNRQVTNPAALRQLLNAPGTFLNDVYVDMIQKGDALLTIRPNYTVTAYYKGGQLFSIPDIRVNSDPSVYEQYLPITRSSVLRSRAVNPPSR